MIAPEPAEQAREEDARETLERQRDGFVLVWFALLIVVLLGIAAMAVDLVHAYAEEQHAQNAADAAALAGATDIPLDTSSAHTTAQAKALDIAQNQYGFKQSGDSVVATADANPNQIDVTVTRHFSTFFSSILGFPKLTIHATGKAQFDPSASMGSAVNHLGDVPVCENTLADPAAGGWTAPGPGAAPGNTECTTDDASGVPGGWIQHLWASIQGPVTDKQSGNALTTNLCDTNNAISVDGCEPGQNGRNDENDGKPEQFQLGLPTNSQWDVWVYDPSFVGTNPTCGVTGAPFANTFTTGSGSDDNWSTSLNPAYRAVSTNYTKAEFCTGDTYGVPPVTGPSMETDFEVLSPPNGAAIGTPDDECQSTREGGVATDPSDPDRVKFPGFGDGGSNGPLAAFNAEQTSGGTQKSYFHQWYRLCTISGGPTSDGNEYSVAVTSPSGLGTNQFSIMVLPHFGTSDTVATPAIQGTQVFARKLLPLVAVNYAAGSAGTSTTFYLARILPSSQTRVLQLSFFDLGDSSTNTGSAPKSGKLHISALNVQNATLSCTYTPAPLNSVPPRTSPAIVDFPPSAFTGGGCDVPYDAGSASNTSNGRWISVRIKLFGSGDTTNGYRCDTSKLQDCWITLGYQPDPGATLSDATTWDAHMTGSPVRLVG